MDANKIFEIKALLFEKQMELIKDQPNELKGRAREVLLQDFLNPFLPGNLGIDGGVVISSNGETSGEIDLVIYDKNAYDLFKPFAGFMPTKSRPFPCEVVYTIIEVENKLGEPRLKEIAEKFKKAKNFPKKAFYEQTGAIVNTVNLYGKEFQYFPITGIIFAYDSVGLENLCKKLFELNSAIPPEHQIDSICVLNKGLVAYRHPTTKAIQFPYAPECELKYFLGSPAQNLRCFYLMLMRILAQVWTRPIRVLDYYQK